MRSLFLAAIALLSPADWNGDYCASGPPGSTVPPPVAPCPIGESRDAECVQACKDTWHGCMEAARVAGCVAQTASRETYHAEIAAAIAEFLDDMKAASIQYYKDIQFCNDLDGPGDFGYFDCIGNAMNTLQDASNIAEDKMDAAFDQTGIDHRDRMLLIVEDYNAAAAQCRDGFYNCLLGCPCIGDDENPVSSAPMRSVMNLAIR